MTNNELNLLFDHVIQQDVTFKISRSAVFPDNQLPLEKVEKEFVYPKDDGNVFFDHVCLSEDPELAKKATDQLFSSLEADFNNQDLHKLAYFVDTARHIQILEQKLEQLSTAVSPGDAALKGHHKQQYYNHLKALFSFLNHHSYYLGKVYGRAMWRKFIENKPYWDRFTDTFQIYPLCILENCFRDSTLSELERRGMLFQSNPDASFYKGQDVYGMYRARFFKLLCKAYPDRIIPREDFDQLQLEHTISYTVPLGISPDEVRPYATEFPPDIENSVTLLHDLNDWAKRTDLREIDLTIQEKFDWSLKTREDCIIDFFNRNNRVVAFIRQTRELPTNFVNLFAFQFEPILKKAGISDIEVSQITTPLDERTFHYKVFVKSHAGIYEHEYESGSEVFDPQVLVKMLNVCLIKKRSTLRWIDINPNNIMATFVLAEPGAIKLFLDKHFMGCCAISMSDDFYKLEG